MNEIKAGDELAFCLGNTYYSRGRRLAIHTVERITPTGRIVCGPYTLEPNLKIRGPHTPFTPWRVLRPTPEIREECEVDSLCGYLSGVTWRNQPLAVLRAAAAAARGGRDLLAELKHLVGYLETLEAHGLIDLEDEVAAMHCSVLINAVAAIKQAEAAEKPAEKPAE